MAKLVGTPRRERCYYDSRGRPTVGGGGGGPGGCGQCDRAVGGRARARYEAFRAARLRGHTGSRGQGVFAGTSQRTVAAIDDRAVRWWGWSADESRVGARTARDRADVRAAKTVGPAGAAMRLLGSVRGRWPTHGGRRRRREECTAN